MELFFQYCGAVLATNQSLLVTLFLGGLVGGLTHCSGMCGPFVLAMQGKQSGGAFARAKGALLLPYHLGRMTTYMVLGIVAAVLSGVLLSEPLQMRFATGMLVLAGIAFLVSAVPVAKVRLLPIAIIGPVAAFGRFVGELAKPFSRMTNSLGRYGLGVLLGFLPCGMLAAALMAAASTTEPLAAAFAMAAFCAGTAVPLFGVGLGGQAIQMRWPDRVPMITRGMMVFSGISLFAIAGGMIS